jgi:phosphohistidine swiveling domain-containing protein
MTASEGPIWVTIITRRGGNMLFSYPINEGAKQHFPDLYGLDIKFSNYIYRSPDGPIMMDARELGAAAGVIKERLETGIWTIFTEPVYKQAEKLINTGKQISALDVKSLDNATLKYWFHRYFDELAIFNPVYWGNPLAVMALEEIINEQLGEKLEERGERGRLEQYLEALIYPTRRSAIEQARRELAKLAAEIQDSTDLSAVFQNPPDRLLATLPKNHPEFFSKIEEFVQHFAFINTDYWRGEPLSVREALGNLQTYLKLKGAKQELAAMHKQEQEREGLARKLIKELEIKGRLLRLIEFARELFTVKQYMREASLKAGTETRELFVEIGKRVGFTYDELLYFTPPEVVEALEGKVPEAAVIRQRLEDGFGLYYLNNKLRIVVGEELAKDVAAATGEQPWGGELTGGIAYPGKYEGLVRIVHVREESDKMQGGDVLVAPMTDPYILPAMLKAGAIVTDEGGLLSHAAIVAREERIPCIVGTQRATKVLHDGDMVEIDAEGTRASGHTGIVRILRKAQSVEN